VKATIVAKYFWSWATIVKKTARTMGGKIAYLDLYCGPGIYENGVRSTPLRVLESAIADTDIRQMLVPVLNDINPEHIERLQEAVNNLPGIETLRYAPQYSTDEVNDKMAEALKQVRKVPTLVFLDPCGYKGLSLDLIGALIKDWGCDCITFFNYNRINMHLPNQDVNHLLDALFGAERADSLREQIGKFTPEQREQRIMAEIQTAFENIGGKYVLPFRFEYDRAKRTSHYLIHITKHRRGHEIMKKIMAKESSNNIQGIPAFKYTPFTPSSQLPLFQLSSPLEDLKESILTDFAGRSLTMERVYEEHNIGKPYIARNYKDALLSLEASGEIQADPPANIRRAPKGRLTFGNDVVVAFPTKEVTNGSQVRD
jgi:three-Cys-motif partner protein